MTHSDDLLRLKNLRIEAMEKELQNLKEQLMLSEAQVEILQDTLKDYLQL
jgi:hypothetical protein